MHKSDIVNDLVIRIAKGDSKAFSKFYDLYFYKVFQFARYFIKSDFICQEIVSDVFLSIWNKRSSLPEIENLTSYLFTITRNRAFDFLDKSSRLPEFTSDIPVEISANTTDPEELTIYRELESVVNTAINELPEKCKIVFLMSRDENLRYKDIAQILDISEKTVQAQIITALKKIGAFLKNYLHAFLLVCMI